MFFNKLPRERAEPGPLRHGRFWRSGFSIPAVLMAAGMAGGVALVVSTVSRQIVGTQKSVEVTLAENNLMARVNAALYDAESCEATLSSAGPLQPGHSLPGIYTGKRKPDGTLERVKVVEKDQLWERMIQVDDITLEFDPATFTDDGTKKTGEVALIMDIERTSKAFQGFRNLKRKIVLTVTTDMSDEVTSCRSEIASEEVVTVVGQARELACTDIGGTYSEAADGTVSCDVSQVLGNNGGGPGRGPSSAVAIEMELVSTDRAFAALLHDDGVACWGDRGYGGDCDSVAGLSDVKEVSSNRRAFAAAKHDGTVACWGNSGYGGACSSVTGLSGVEEVFSADKAFAAVKGDKSVVCWGDAAAGGNCSSVAGLDNVQGVFSTATAFAALKSDKSVVCWGNSNSGGDCDSVAGLDNVKTVFSNGNNSFAALKTDGSVVCWGVPPQGGDCSSVSGLSGVAAVAANKNAFAAVKTDGSVVCWGAPYYGGDCSSVSGLDDVKEVFSTERAFAAVKNDGSVVCWGHSAYGGNCSSVSGVEAVASNDNAFAAVKDDGSVVCWGSAYTGGDCSSVAGLDGVDRIFAAGGAFAALKDDGSIAACWGQGAYGGTCTAGVGNVREVVDNERAFAALRNDGIVLAWGDERSGGKIPDETFLLMLSSLPASSGPGVVVQQQSSPVSEAAACAQVGGVYDASGSPACTASDSTRQMTCTGLGGTWTPGGSPECGAGATMQERACTDVGGTYDAADNPPCTLSPGSTTPTTTNTNADDMEIFSNGNSFAALLSDDTVACWGNSGGDCSSVTGLSDVKEIFSTNGAYAALKNDENVVCWGGRVKAATAPRSPDSRTSRKFSPPLTPLPP